MAMTTSRITLLAGPTASGKSALALKWAQTSGAVIVNADSQQLYADLRVLSARPSPEDEARVEHRLYGIADGAEAWSVGRWSRAVLKELGMLGDRPAIIVGGTGLYFTALTKGLAEIPSVPQTQRDHWVQAYDQKGEAVVRSELGRRDPDAERRIAPGDRQRLIRALSVATHTGRALSDWQADTRPLLPPKSWKGYVLRPERADLYARCDARFEAMLDQGALIEVQALMERRLSPDLPVMKAVGVRELAAFQSGQMSLDEAVAAARQATRNYAKRQLTWFRNQMGDWVTADLTPGR